jgi:hypothetical protein
LLDGKRFLSRDLAKNGMLHGSIHGRRGPAQDPEKGNLCRISDSYTRMDMGQN